MQPIQMVKNSSLFLVPLELHREYNRNEQCRGQTLGNTLASGVVVILDGMDRPQYQPGSLAALQRLLAANNEFIADEKSREIHFDLCVRRIFEARARLALCCVPGGESACLPKSMKILHRKYPAS